MFDKPAIPNERIHLSIIVLNKLRNSIIVERTHPLVDDNIILVPTIEKSVEVTEFDTLIRALGMCTISSTTFTPKNFVHVVTRRYNDADLNPVVHKWFRLVSDEIMPMSKDKRFIEFMTLAQLNRHAEFATNDYYLIQPGLLDALEIYNHGYNPDEGQELESTDIQIRTAMSGNPDAAKRLNTNDKPVDLTTLDYSKSQLNKLPY